jgi:NAD(P)-dependent dehydrogenase (short-subunit alcohol dehydrogenase family)
MRSAAIEGAAKRIRVNTVNPSPIDTPMIATIEMMRGLGGSNDQPLARATPLGRYGAPEEVAHMMLFLASDDSSFGTIVQDRARVAARHVARDCLEARLALRIGGNCA